MRRELRKAEIHKTMRDMLIELGPASMATYLREGPGRTGSSPRAPGRDLPGKLSPGFMLQIDRETAEVEEVSDHEKRYRIKGTRIAVGVEIEYSNELATLVQSVTLTNEGKEASGPISSLYCFHIPLNVRVKDRPVVMSVGGGSTKGFYPSPAYREELISFGYPMEWEDPSPTFTRWWMAQRFYKMTSGDEARSSSDYCPVLLSGWNGDGGIVGIWAAMEWSGRWEMEMGCTDDWRFYLRGGPQVKGMVLDPGETIRLPRTHVGVYGGKGCTIEDGSNSVRRHVAQVIAPDVQGRRPWPYVAYSHWAGIEHNVNEKLMMEQADRAVELGLEFLEVDAGWYGDATDNFANGVGNWERVDEKKFPDGLEPLARYTKEKGMGFGLWFEPERGRLGSDWVTEHPDWYWSGRSPVNFHLNLTKKVVQDNLTEMLSRWIEKLDIRWLRWDNNQAHGPYWDELDPTGKIQFAYMAGLYRVFSILVERHPNLMIDNCAGGGNRSDFGTLRSSGTMVISDHVEDPHVCRIMQTGGARFLPGNYMNSGIYCSERDPAERIGPLELISRFSGCISLSGHISHLSKEHVETIRYYLDGFKRFRHLMMDDFYRLTPYPRSPADWDVVEFLNPESGEAVILAYRFEGDTGAQTILPKKLKPGAFFDIVDPFSQEVLSTEKAEKLLKDGFTFDLELNSALVRHLKVKD
jgi:hypothetical protein